MLVDEQVAASFHVLRRESSEAKLLADQATKVLR